MFSFRLDSDIVIVSSDATITSLTEKMPNYCGRGVNIQLYTIELDKSVTESLNINSRHQGQIATTQQAIDPSDTSKYEKLRAFPIGTLDFLKDEDGRPQAPFWTVVSGPSIQNRRRNGHLSR